MRFILYRGDKQSMNDERFGCPEGVSKHMLNWYKEKKIESIVKEFIDIKSFDELKIWGKTQGVMYAKTYPMLTEEIRKIYETKLYEVRQNVQSKSK